MQRQERQIAAAMHLKASSVGKSTSVSLWHKSGFNRTTETDFKQSNDASFKCQMWRHDGSQSVERSHLDVVVVIVRAREV